MTLNFPPWSTLPANTLEEDFISSVRVNGGERNMEGLTRPLQFNWDDSYDLGKDRDEKRGSFESNSNDILDLLPKDPFDMDLSATFTAIASWLEDLEIDSEDSESDLEGSFKDDYEFVPGLDFFWDAGLMIGSEREVRFNELVEKDELADWSYDSEFVSDWDIEEILSFGDEDIWAQCDQPKAQNSGSFLGGDGEAPHDAMEYVINYLDLPDILNVEMVCRSMRSWVRGDHSLWKSIQVDQPLSERLTDDALIHLTGRAQGGLQALSLLECPRITDDGLNHVFLSNPTLTKLSVLGCTRLSIEGLVNNLKAFNSERGLGLKCLRIGELYGVTHEHFEELKLLLGAHQVGQLHKAVRRPRLYPFRHSSHSIDWGSGVIDIEICSRCGNPKILYDCPVEGCQGEPPTPQGCRACSFCIQRCCWCGICINSDSEYEETFSLEWICSCCSKEKAHVLGS